MIATGGGQYDRTAAPIYFAAGTSHSHYPRHTLMAVNDIEGEHGERVLRRMIDEGHVLLLDSGIFALTNAYKRQTDCTMDEALALAPEEVPGFNAGLSPARARAPG